MNKKLFERIGGNEAIELAAEKLYPNILKDDRINRFFEDIDVKKQARKMHSFLTYAFGGPSLYTGLSMRNAHHKLVEKGLNDAHFDALMENIRKTLAEIGKDESLINEVVGSLEVHRKDVLGR